MSDNNSPLPKGWTACTVDGITAAVSKIDGTDELNREITYIDISSIDNEQNKIVAAKRLWLKEAPSRARQIVKEGDTLFATVRPYLRNIAFVGQEYDTQIASTGFCVLRPAPGIDPKFLFYVASSRDFVNSVSGQQYGVSYPAVKDEQVRAHEILLPPSNEQRRIVAKLEELLSELDKGLDNLNTTQEQLRAYRHAVLKQAFEGRLTADWRNSKKDQLELGQALRSRILRERKLSWEDSQIERFQQLGSSPTNDRWKERYSEPEPFERVGLPSLPPQWCWASLDELVSGKPRSMQSGPFGSNLKHSEFKQSGILVIGIDNVRDGWFSIGNQNRISEKKFRELAKYQARPGDLLITVMASLGRTCVVPRDLETAIITKHVYRISMEEENLYPEYFNLLLQSQTMSRRRMFESAQGQTRPG